MLITSNFPIDETFLSSIMNEGILYLINNISCRITFDKNKNIIIMKSNYDLRDAFKEVYSSINQNISVSMVRNDRHFLRDFKKYFNIDANIKQTFQDLLLKIKENIDKFEFKYDNLNLSIVVKGSIVFLESNEREVDIVVPQIFKVDRFTGYTSLDGELTTKQVKQRCLGETTLLLILGLVSSYVCSRKDGDNWYYYFLTFAPEDVLKLYLEENYDLIRKFLNVKNEIIEILRKSYTITPVNEIPLTELALNLKIQKLLNKYNLDKISLVLFKIAREGQDSYKIYEQIPIRIHRKIAFAEIVERYFKNPDEFIKRLSEMFENKNSRLWKALASLNSKNKFDEADSALKAMQGLYRFVILGDLQGYYQFVREIANCYRIYENSNKNVAVEYKMILEGVRWF